MSRYPYTYAADYVRHLGGYGKEGCKLSRADASRIIRGISKALGYEEEHPYLYEKLANYHQKHEKQISEDGARQFLDGLGIGVKP